jgi:hypothetical protein
MTGVRPGVKMPVTIAHVGVPVLGAVPCARSGTGRCRHVRKYRYEPRVRHANKHLRRARGQTQRAEQGRFGSAAWVGSYLRVG